MSKMLLGISPEYIYIHNKTPIDVSNLHRPYFLTFSPENSNIKKARDKLMEKWKKGELKEEISSKILDIGNIEEYQSFSNFGEKIKTFKVFTDKSYYVPEVSDYLFFNQNFFTAEHDIPYQQRVLVDMESENKAWIFDTNGRKETLKILVYDIETTKYLEQKENIPIDIIGYSDFSISFESKKDLKNEEFSFNILDCPEYWSDMSVKQLIARNIDEEIDNLFNFLKYVNKYDIISGHNILGFDNKYIYERLKWILNVYGQNLSNNIRGIFQEFVSKYSRIDRSFHFGTRSDIVQFYPCSLDTYMGVRKFYSFLNDFSLKAVAPFLGVKIDDRLILNPSQIKLDDKTLRYNKHDVQEQLGVTLNLIQQALPLSFTTGMPFDMLLSSGAVNMWDHMSLIRSALQKKIMPPICRVFSISQVLLRDFKDCETKGKIAIKSKKISERLSKEFVRVVKYGNEMPQWMENPNVILNINAKNPDEKLNYHMPGGMTIKPDKNASSHFIPWWYVIVADVGAMYPTILKAMNVGADTVRLAKKNEKPDEWFWLKKIPEDFLKTRDIQWRLINKEDTYADKGYMLGIKIDENPGVVNCAMTGILSMISKVKSELTDVKKTGKNDDIKRLKMMYQSLKGARNAGTHGILSAPGVSGRQFNLWGAATITTKGQMILADTLKYLNEKRIRVVYGDTDGIYIGCSRSATNLKDFSNEFNIKYETDGSTWITKPEIAISVIDECNKKWQKELDYQDFELEPEKHDAMIFVKHKNYLIFDIINGEISMNTKGNNFKGSDKANIARKILKQIMINVLKENLTWNDEEKARQSVKKLIISETKKTLTDLDLSKVEINDLTLIQAVQPSGNYKRNQDGSTSVFGKRSEALEKVLKRKIKSREKFKFVVTKRPLPNIKKPSKSGVKPIDYMYPIDLLKDQNQIDLEWYKKMIENYIHGAFGLSEIKATEQRGLDAWM